MGNHPPIKVKCSYCGLNNEDTVCDLCLLRIVSQKDDLTDLLFFLSEIATASNLSGISENLLLLTEIYHRLQKKTRNFSVTSLKEAIETAKKEAIITALEYTDGNQTEAAKVLNIQRTYLSSLLNKLDIKDTI